MSLVWLLWSALVFGQDQEGGHTSGDTVPADAVDHEVDASESAEVAPPAPSAESSQGPDHHDASTPDAPAGTHAAPASDPLQDASEKQPTAGSEAGGGHGERDDRGLPPSEAHAPALGEHAVEDHGATSSDHPAAAVEPHGEDERTAAEPGGHPRGAASEAQGVDERTSVERPDADSPVSLPGVPRGLTDALLPRLPMRSPLGFLFLSLVTLISVGLAQLAARGRRALLPRGLLPSILGAAAPSLRVLAVFTGLGALAAVVPESIAPALPYVVVAGAVAVGWSARDFLPDLIAWLLLLMERSVRPGAWVIGQDFRGKVVRVGLRATKLRDEHGQLVALPNRRLLGEALRVEPAAWPVFEMNVEVAGGEPRRRIGEAVACCPWVAPGSRPEIIAVSGEEWTVRVRLLELRFGDRFAGTVRELLR